MSTDSNPGSATPYSLYKLYKAQGAVMANPCVLRQQFGTMPSRPLTLAAPPQSARVSVAPRLAAPTFQLRAATGRSQTAGRNRSDSPPRMAFKTLQQRGLGDVRTTQSIELSLSSLNMDRRH